MPPAAEFDVGNATTCKRIQEAEFFGAIPNKILPPVLIDRGRNAFGEYETAAYFGARYPSCRWFSVI